METSEWSRPLHLRENGDFPPRRKEPRHMAVGARVATLQDFGEQASAVRHSLRPAAQEEGFMIGWS